ncbi:MAG TPA: hypothetical protein VFV99_09205, partial [Kofleriaceae bacterium]|nr:hypothetical protein [Kofleriaceae bacterium]
SVAAACSFSHGVLPDDGGVVDMPLPDAAKCLGSSTECLGDVLRTCPGAGSDAFDTPCGWGCMPGSAARCLQIVPSGSGGTATNGVLVTDVAADAALSDITIPGGVTFDSDLGNIGTNVMPTMFHSAATGVDKGIDFQYRGPISVWRFKSLTISGNVTLVGKRPIALVADGPITINGVIDARGGCLAFNAGPGGFGGGSNQSEPGLPTVGGGSGSPDNTSGGGGGGHGGSGATGNGVAGGSAFGDDLISTLVGGGGGGAGKCGNNNCDGGGGGGALQIVSNTRIVVQTGGVNAGGCGGKQGTGNGDTGGGGGAGGAILFEAPTVTIAAALAANGGGGGGGGGNGSTTAGGNGSLDRTPAAAGTGNSNGEGGGSGAAANIAPGPGGNTGNPGGGGGGIGRIRINTKDNAGATLTGATLSPGMSEPAFSTGSAALQ